MSAAGRIAVFAVCLLAVFAGSVGIGSVVDPAHTETEATHDEGAHAAEVDGTGFRHLHPEMEEGGVWRVPVELGEAGVYRVFADFSVAGKQHTPAGESSSLTFAVSRGGEEVDDLAPYLGAKGHLVALREGDLAFLHVHPEQAEGAHAHGGHAEAEGGTADEIAFAASFPTAGRYRLYLQFKHEGAVRTAQFTVSVPR